MLRIGKRSILVTLVVMLAATALNAPGALAGRKNFLVRSGASATVVRGQGCQVTKNPDHSITVACSRGNWALVRWSVATNARPSVWVNSAHPLSHRPVFKQAVVSGTQGYTISQIVHSNTISSVLISGF